MSDGNLEQLAADVVRMVKERGATASECTIAEGSQFSVNVRMGEVEKLTEASSRGAGIRVLVGKRGGSSYTSDLTREGLAKMVDSAVGLAKFTSEDPFAGLPDPDELGTLDGDLDLFSPDVERLETPYKIEQARLAEEVSLEADPRIVNSEGGSFGTHAGRRTFANSLGFAGSYRTTSCSISVSPVAKSGDSMERDYWYSAARNPARLEDAATVGRKAAARALRRLNPRKVPTQRVPVIFDARNATALAGDLFDAASGTSVYRKASFLVDRLGEIIASSLITLIDDATLPGLFGTSPFDDEGVPSRRTVVIQDGVLKSWLLNSYSARKLGLKTTGNASRGLSGNAGVSNGNLYFSPGTQAPEEIIAGVQRGLYVTELMGSGANIVTGDYSCGAAGLWIENGEFAFPVSEITIAGTLQEMLPAIDAVGNDLEFRSAVASPTLRIAEMTVSGQ
ncbi:MAG: metallopeptidase TldD-related protein [Bryobacteraceae bacterium]